MEVRNVRYGVVNVVERERYEKQWHVPFGYNYISYDEADAVKVCRRKKGPNWIVEKIFHTNEEINRKAEIFRGGNFKGKG